MPKKVLIAIPPALLSQVDFVALSEHRTRSDLIREALRKYVAGFKPTEVSSCVPQPVEGNEDRPSERQQLEHAYALPLRAID